MTLQGFFFFFSSGAQNSCQNRNSNVFFFFFCCTWQGAHISLQLVSVLTVKNTLKRVLTFISRFLRIRRGPFVHVERVCVFSCALAAVSSWCCQWSERSVSVLPDEGFLHIRAIFYFIGWVKIVFRRREIFFVPFGEFKKMGCLPINGPPPLIPVVW